MFEDEEYVEITVKVRKSTLEGLRGFEDVYYTTVEDMLTLEADELLDNFQETANM